jgi:hypothetical protein
VSYIVCALNRQGGLSTTSLFEAHYNEFQVKVFCLMFLTVCKVLRKPRIHKFNSKQGYFGNRYAAEIHDMLDR